MNKNITKVSDYFKVGKIRDKSRIVVFLICLSIASSLWFLNALGKNYTAKVSYPVKFVNPPANRFLAGKIPAKLDLEMEGQGFSLLRFKFISFIPITLDIENITKNVEANKGAYIITSRNLIREISEQLKSEIKITTVYPENITLVLDSLMTKTVPVEFDINVEFEPQFNLKSPVSIQPDRVKITGPESQLDKISVIKTKVNIINKLNSSIRQEIELIHPEKTKISPEKVNLIIDVEKYTEKEFKIPIEILHKPERASIKLFPSELKVVFTVGLSRFENTKASDFGAMVDYNSIVPDVNSLKVNLYKKPDFIQSFRYAPEKVEFLIETN